MYSIADIVSSFLDMDFGGLNSTGWSTVGTGDLAVSAAGVSDRDTRTDVVPARLTLYGAQRDEVT
jgi:hypothetical protein